MDRRKFLAISALGVAATAVDPMVPAAQAAKAFKPSRKEKAAGEYSIVILGDTHFDTEPASVYHSDYNETVEWLNRVQRAEGAGSFKMNVSEHGIVIDFYGGGSEEITESFVIR